MEIFTNPSKLELQFSSARLSPPDIGEGCTIRALRAISWVIGGSVATSIGLGPLVLVAFLLWVLFGGSKKGRRDSSRYHTQITHLILDLHSKRTCSMSLESSARGQGERSSQINALPLVDIVAEMHSGRIDLFYKQPSAHYNQCISIYGSSDDIHWLRDTVNQWELVADFRSS